jgi:hypothetical protein
VVGSRASSRVQEARAQRLLDWAEDLERRRLKRIWFGSLGWTKLLGPDPADIASRVMCAIARQKDDPHPEVLAILDELLGIGRTRDGWPDPSIDRTAIDDYLSRLLSTPPAISAIAAPRKAPAITSPG